MELREIREETGWKVELVEGERSVSWLWIADRQMRIGACPVWTGGIAGVGTEREYRKQGLASQVLKAAIALMGREGYDASFLYGIQDFYHRFGFVTCMAENDLELETREAERAARHLWVRPVKAADRAAITRIYNRENERRTASVVRDARHWKDFRMGSAFGVQAGVRVVVDDRDRVQGYLVYDEVENRCRAAEIGGHGEAVWSTLLHFLARRAIDLRRERLSLSLPADHAFARFCRNFGCTDCTRYPRNAGPMGRIIDLHRFLDKLRPELERRWGTDKAEESLVLKTDLGGGKLHWQQGRLLLEQDDSARGAVRLGQEALMLLAMGYRSAVDLKAENRLQASAAQVALLERLFPPQQAHMWWPDRF